MRRILFDQGVPVPLREALSEHSVKTVHELGWSTLTNGELLKKLTSVQMAIVVLPTTKWTMLRTHASRLAQAIAATKAGQYVELML